ncbi:hypothetical protein KTAU_20760 [Thermogemmatispora aurantia]|uniref:Uncharacterized protein n=1 Tax=Thermogemmatispora aurantia TaxID=2045279 RepID=A0A5J4K9M7_9CHLR|nr:hypothetical protein KTAU_20760 [Thermogemmatispora aurantia]
MRERRQVREIFLQTESLSAELDMVVEPASLSPTLVFDRHQLARLLFKRVQVASYVQALASEIEAVDAFHTFLGKYCRLIYPLVQELTL